MLCVWVGWAVAGVVAADGVRPLFQHGSLQWVDTSVLNVPIQLAGMCVYVCFVFSVGVGGRF